MKLKTILFLLFVFLIVSIVVLLLVRHGSGNRIPDSPETIGEDTFDFSQNYLCRIYYWHGAGSLGDSCSLEMTVEPDEDGKPLVRVEYYNQPAAGEKAVEKTVRVSSDAVRDIQEIIDRYGMKEWVDLPPAEFFALDAPSTSLSWEFSDGSSYSIGSGDELPDDGYRAIAEIRQYLMECAGIKE